MSVIFKALAKLERNPSADTYKPAKGVPRLFFARRAWIPLGIILTGILCLALVWAAQDMSITEGSGKEFGSDTDNGDLLHKAVFHPAQAGPGGNIKPDFKSSKYGADSGKISQPDESVGEPGGSKHPQNVLEAEKKSCPGKKIVIAKNVNPNSQQATHISHTDKSGPEQQGQANKLLQTAGGKNGQLSGRAQAIAALVKQRRRTAELVSDFRVAMNGNNLDQARLLLEKISRLKGEDNILVMKLKAYWMIQSGQWLEAETVLKSILEKFPDDLEAGVNLAVAMIKIGRIQEARLYLEKLYLRFPEDDRIGTWLEMLNR